MHKEHASFTQALLFSSTRHGQSVVFGEYLEREREKKRKEKKNQGG